MVLQSPLCLGLAGGQVVGAGGEQLAAFANVGKSRSSTATAHCGVGRCGSTRRWHCRSRSVRSVRQPRGTQAHPRRSRSCGSDCPPSHMGAQLGTGPGDLQRLADGIGGQTDLGCPEEDGAERLPGPELVDGAVTGGRQDGQYRPVGRLATERGLRHAAAREVPNGNGSVGKRGPRQRSGCEPERNPEPVTVVLQLGAGDRSRRAHGGRGRAPLYQRPELPGVRGSVPAVGAWPVGLGWVIMRPFLLVDPSLS